MEKEKIIKSSGNVFADLGMKNAEEKLAKTKIMHQIEIIIKKKKLSQAQAAKLLGIDQPKVSALLKGRLSGFSLDRLFRFLQALDQDIEIKIKPKPPRSRRRGKVSVQSTTNSTRL